MLSILDRIHFRRRRPGTYVCDASLAQLAIALPPSVYLITPISRRRIAILDRRHPNLPPVAAAKAPRRRRPATPTSRLWPSLKRGAAAGSSSVGCSPMAVLASRSHDSPPPINPEESTHDIR